MEYDILDTLEKFSYNIFMLLLYNKEPYERLVLKAKKYCQFSNLISEV
jgi:hypothetical protein